MFAGNNGGISYMYYDGSVRIATSGTGVAVTGTVTADGLTIDGGNTLRLDAASTADFFTIVQGGTQAVLTADSDAAANMLFRTASAGVDTDRMQILSNGDIEIYEDTGTTPKLVWDASAESLTLSGTGGLDVTGSVTADGLTVATTGVTTAKIEGSQAKLQFFETDTVDQNYQFRLNGGDLILNTLSDLDAVTGEVLRLNSTGIDVTGTVTADTVSVNNDAASITIRNDASNRHQRFRRNASNSLILDKDNGTTTTNTAKFDENGDISFYEDTGTTPKFFWDASAESLGLVRASPASSVDIRSANTAVQSRGNLYVTTTSTAAINEGAQISLGGTYTGAAETFFGAIAARKENATVGDFNAYLQFSVRSTGNLSEKMRIDSAGQVGIGTDSPNTKVEISGAKNTSELRLSSTNNDSSWVAGDYIGKLSFYSADQSAAGAGIKGSIATVAVPPSGGTTNMVFSVATISSNEHEAMRIDASGNLLVGTTSTNPYTSATETGAVVRGDEGILGASRSGGASLRVNRVGTGGTENGDIAEFRSNGAVVGSITSDAGYLAIGKGDTGLLFQDGGDAIQPRDITGGANRDAAIDLGVSGGRFKDLYLSGGVYLGGIGAANLLDDYEEGTWTPTVTGSTTAGSYSNVAHSANYTKVGNLVSVNMYFYGASGTGAGDLLIGGLPFSLDSTSNAVGVIQANSGLVYPTGTNEAVFQLVANATYGEVRCNKTDGSAFSKMQYPTTAGYIRISLTYTTA